MKGLQQFLTSPMMQSKFVSTLTTSFFGWLAEQKLPKKLLHFLIKKYANGFNVEMEKYNFQIDEAVCFQQFFTREIKSEFIRFSGKLASPVEASMASSGAIQDGLLVQVKGVEYPMNKLVDEAAFTSGSYLTLYLGLGDYHHVHLPFDAQIDKVKRIGGANFATNLKALTQRRDIYLKNERLIIKGSCEFGTFFLVLVGATCVGKIKLPAELQAGVVLKQGAKIGTFEMGSTVALIVENQGLAKLKTRVGDKLALGQKLII